MACPKLMPFLSRTGNASHGVERTQTALQACKRIHSIVSSSFPGVVKPDWDEVAKIASVGMGPKYFETAKCYGKFVKEWSGGKDASILKELEEYERTVSSKWKLDPEDMAAVGSVEFPEAPRWIPVMVKASLSSPSQYAPQGTSK